MVWVGREVVREKQGFVEAAKIEALVAAMNHTFLVIP